MKIGFIGTGDMGNPMAMNLIKAGFDVTVNTRRRFRAENLIEAGASWAETARELEDCEVIFTALPGPKQFEEVIIDPQIGLLGVLKPGSAIFDTTTNSPDLVRRIAEECQKRGVYLLDSPISGGSMGAEAGTLTFMVGGDKSIFEKHLPILQAMGKNLFYMGDVGAGCAVKLVTQYMGYSNLVTAYEAMLIAKKAGLDLSTVYNVVPVTAGNFGLYQNFFRGIFGRNFGTPEAGGVDMIAKDLMLGNELAEAVGAPHRMGQNAYNVFKQAQEEDLGGYVLTASVKVLEAEAGEELEAKLE